MAKSINEKLKSLLGNLLNFVFPQKAEEKRVRQAGFTAFANRLVRVSSEKDFIFLFRYKDPFIREAIWLLKYRRNPWLAKVFAGFVYEVLLEELSDKIVFENFEKPLLVPIPLSKKRLRERSFNQTELVTKEIIKKDAENFLELDTESLIKIRETESQTRKSKKERGGNIKGSFAVRNPERIKGQNIILLDDVLTTGSTITEAERILKENGARKVFKIILAH